MTNQSPDQIAARWAQGLAGAGSRIQSGVQGVTTAPGQAAARQVQAWQTNTQAAAQKWAARTGSITLSEWQNSMVEKGIPRIGAGAQAAQPKFAQFMSTLLPNIQSVVQSLPPRGNIDANIARAAAFARGLNQRYSK